MRDLWSPLLSQIRVQPFVHRPSQHRVFSLHRGEGPLGLLASGTNNLCSSALLWR